MTTPSADSSRPVSFVWLVPFLALLISGWLLYREFNSRGQVISIEFANGSGIQAGKTPLIHQGVVIGLVQSVDLNQQLNGVIVKVELDHGAAPIAVEGSEFWLVQPEIGFSGIKGIETLLSGAQIKVHPGSGRPVRRFTALPKIPAREAFAAGRRFVIRADKLGSLNPGAPVHYREVKVGVVDTHRLADDATQVLITINIFEPFHRLVRKDTHFWNAGGISMKVGLLGAQVHSNSLESLVAGGLAFATPEHDSVAEPAEEGTEFLLHEDAEKSWLKWQPKIDLTQPAG